MTQTMDLKKYEGDMIADLAVVSGNMTFTDLDEITKYAKEESVIGPFSCILLTKIKAKYLVETWPNYPYSKRAPGGTVKFIGAGD
jgi:hypothetical protein